MPTYAYLCRDCGTALEVQQSFTDDALTVCPTCGGHLRKQYGTVGVTFNGSGFYRTDSRSSGSTSSTSSSPSSSESSGSSSSSPSSAGESKPAAAPKPAATPGTSS